MRLALLGGGTFQNRMFPQVNQYLTDHPRVIPVTGGAIAPIGIAYLRHKAYQ